MKNKRLCRRPDYRQHELLRAEIGSKIYLAVCVSIGIALLVGVQNARIVLCGHAHIARAMTSDGTLIVSPGSVTRHGPT